MPPKRNRRSRNNTAKQLREAEILLQRIKDAGLNRVPKKRRRTRLAIFIEGNDVTIVRPGHRNRIHDSGSYDYSYDSYGYYDDGFYSYDYDYNYGYSYNYDYGYSYDYGYYGVPFDRPTRKTNTTLTLTIEIKSDGRVQIFKDHKANRRARRASKWLRP